MSWYKKANISSVPLPTNPTSGKVIDPGKMVQGDLDKQKENADYQLKQITTKIQQIENVEMKRIADDMVKAQKYYNEAEKNNAPNIDYAYNWVQSVRYKQQQLQEEVIRLKTERDNLTRIYEHADAMVSQHGSNSPLGPTESYDPNKQYESLTNPSGNPFTTMMQKRPSQSVRVENIMRNMMPT